MMHVREGDDPILSTRIRREVPITSVAWIIGLGIVQAVTLWLQVQRQSDSLERLERAQAQVAVKLDSINQALNKTDLKDQEHDIRIQSLTNRVVVLEALYPRQIPQQTPLPLPGHTK